MPLKQCNKCGKTGGFNLFVVSKGYRYGYRPLCLTCRNQIQNEKRKSKLKSGVEIKPRAPRIKQEPFNIEFYEKKIELTEEAVMILINNGFARNREEALRYIQ